MVIFIFACSIHNGLWPRGGGELGCVFPPAGRGSFLEPIGSQINEIFIYIIIFIFIARSLQGRDRSLQGRDLSLQGRNRSLQGRVGIGLLFSGSCGLLDTARCVGWNPGMWFYIRPAVRGMAWISCHGRDSIYKRRLLLVDHPRVRESSKSRGSFVDATTSLAHGYF